MAWKNEVKKSIQSADDLDEIIRLEKEQKRIIEKIIEKYPMAITPYYLSLIDKNNPNDPIARMCIPSAAELQEGGSFDTSGESVNVKAEGIQHKYRQTALILSTNQCAMYCRHCFRRRMVGLGSEELNKRVNVAKDYVETHPEINNVLISGGDSLMNSNEIIKRYLEGLTQIEHIDLIRFGSRLPVTLPERIYGDKEFLDLMKIYSKRKALIVVTQFNHPRELTKEAENAIRSLQENGVQVRNQTVLLRGINDNPEVLGDLLSGLTKRNVIPYYIFQCRPVVGVKEQFQIPIKEGIKIVDQARMKQNGLGKSVRYALSHPKGKIEIAGELGSGEVIFKFHQNKYIEDAARIFTRNLSDSMCWLSDELDGI